MKRIVLIVCGFLALAIGFVGVILPVLPTTPFVLLAAICFSAGHNKIGDWLRKNRIFGPYIENYRTKQGLSIPRKIASIFFVWAGLTISMVMVRTVWAYALLGAVGVGITIHLLMIKTKRK